MSVSTDVGEGMARTSASSAIFPRFAAKRWEQLSGSDLQNTCRGPSPRWSLQMIC